VPYVEAFAEQLLCVCVCGCVLISMCVCVCVCVCVIYVHTTTRSPGNMQDAKHQIYMGQSLTCAASNYSIIRVCVYIYTHTHITHT
jgi:hypothetical protein